MLDLPKPKAPAPAPDGKQIWTLGVSTLPPVIKVNDSPGALGLLLGCIHQQHITRTIADIRSAAEGHRLPDIVEAVKVADKYDVTVAMEMLFFALGERVRGPDVARSDAFVALAAGIVFKRREIAKDAFRAWRDRVRAADKESDDVSSSEDSNAGESSSGENDANELALFCDVDDGLFARLPAEAIHAVLKLEKRTNGTAPISEQNWDDDVNKILRKFFK